MRLFYLAAALAACVGFSAVGWTADPVTPSTEKAAAKPALPFTVSKETTLLTAPLRADGSVDYVAALSEELSRGVTPDNNAAVLFWKAVGPKSINEKIRDRYFEKLDIAPLPETGEYLVDLIEYAKANAVTVPGEDESETLEDRLHKQLDEAYKRPWSKQEFPVLAAWLAANEKPLAVAIEGTKRPRRYDPLLAGEEDMMIAVLLPSCQEHRNIGRLLVARAMLRAQAGDITAAWDDLLACHRLGRLSAQGITLIDALVGIAIDTTACAADRALLEHVPLTAKQAATMRGDLAKLPSLRGMDVKLDRGERFMFLDSVSAVSRRGLSQLTLVAGGPGPGKAIQSFFDALGATAMDWDSVLRNGNRWYDRLVAAARQPTAAQRKAALMEFEKELKKLAGESKNPGMFALEFLGDPQGAISRRISDILIALLMPALMKVMEAEDRAIMQGELVQVGFALAAFRAEQQKYPASLDDLAPLYLPEVPKDLFVDGALRYQGKDGGYLLYSVGPNGTDDGARTRDEAKEGQGWDDLVIRVSGKAKP